jgi:hypothetical protein|eukprot:COSAG06_NODE_405_length_16132_cov_9.166532_6_plen_71_part_00
MILSITMPVSGSHHDTKMAARDETCQDCELHIMIAQFPIENHSEQGQFAELPLKTIGKSAKNGRLLCNSQ